MSEESASPGSIPKEADEKVDITTYAFGFTKTQDVTITLKQHPDHLYLASKAVLSAFSEVFYSMFSNPSFAEKEESSIQLDFKNVTSEDFNFFLEWVYAMRDLMSLKEDETEGQFMALAEIANMYNVKVLKEKLIDKAKDVKWSKRITKEVTFDFFCTFDLYLL
jgi:hypothetical protein